VITVCDSCDIAKTAEYAAGRILDLAQVVAELGRASGSPEPGPIGPSAAAS
jgi:hypothetical protein